MGETLEGLLRPRGGDEAAAVRWLAMADRERILAPLLTMLCRAEVRAVDEAAMDDLCELLEAERAAEAEVRSAAADFGAGTTV